MNYFEDSFLNELEKMARTFTPAQKGALLGTGVGGIVATQKISALKKLMEIYKARGMSRGSRAISLGLGVPLGIAPYSALGGGIGKLIGMSRKKTKK